MLKIALAQLNPTIGDITGNATQIVEIAQQAVNNGANLLLTPELSLCGYPPKDLLLNLSFVEFMENKLQELAGKLPSELTVLVGTVTINEKATIQGEKSLYNSIALITENQVKSYFHKRLLPTYDVFDEDRYFESGKDTNYFMLNNLKIGVTVCEDLWNDDQFWGQRNYEINPIEELAQINPDLMINLSASPYTVGKQKIRESMLSHAARRYQIPFIYANQVGSNDDLIFDGNSVGLNKQGDVICRAKSFQTDLVFMDFEQANHSLFSNSINKLTDTQEEEIYSALVLGVRDYARKCGFNKAILGLSGGIDSSLVAVIAAEALGKNNVLGVLMPSPYSSDHSIKDAEDLVKNLGINSQLLPIGEIMQSYDQLLEPLFSGTEFGVAEENLQSRIRGNLLMAIANKFGYLLLSTGNKSEMAVGYCTLYGDMNGGLAVIADVPKTRVFSLCKWLNRDQEIIPHNVLIKPPSAELKPNQVDQDSLPPYEILDDILEQFVTKHKSAQQIIKSGHEPDTVNKVIKLISRAEFKRKQAPPGLKITDRAFGTGWRMPIASRWSNTN
jgi:NAD+ synthase (glutamine-hydrolysing)